MHPKLSKGVYILSLILKTVFRHIRAENKSNEQKNNLKRAAKKVNLLTEYKIKQYVNLVARICEITSANEQDIKLNEKKETLYADYGKLKKQVKEYNAMKRNIDSFLMLDRRQSKRKNHHIIINENLVENGRFTYKNML